MGRRWQKKKTQRTAEQVSAIPGTTRWRALRSWDTPFESWNCDGPLLPKRAVSPSMPLEGIVYITRCTIQAINRIPITPFFVYYHSSHYETATWGTVSKR
jgi:hypothetical protein